MASPAIDLATAAPAAASQRSPTAPVATANSTTTCGPPHMKEGPVSVGRCRAWGTEPRRESKELPTEADTASVCPAGAGTATGFPLPKAEATLADLVGAPS